MFGKTKYGKRPKAGRASHWGRTLERMFKKDPHCHWCGKVTHMENRGCIVPEPLGATIDHLYSNLDIRRAAEGTRHAIVLSCYSCNQKRCQSDNGKFSHDFKNQRVNILDILKTGIVRVFNNKKKFE